MDVQLMIGDTSEYNNVYIYSRVLSNTEHAFVNKGESLIITSSSLDIKVIADQPDLQIESGHTTYKIRFPNMLFTS